MLPRIAVGYVIAYISFIPFIWKQRNQLRKDPHSLQPEARLYWLLFSTYSPLIVDARRRLTRFPSGPSRTDRPVWLRVDEFGSPARTLDSTYDLRSDDRHS